MSFPRLIRAIAGASSKNRVGRDRVPTRSLTFHGIWKTSLLFLSSFKERDFEFSPFPRRVGG
ncbi:MAG: hypothetical protein V7L01_01135 [Nostoc sp.]|uniref:hypothetical protein n=1 Tax=Nostoc sp. TaxID=1180 RepID=UPI002FF526CB